MSPPSIKVLRLLSILGAAFVLIGSDIRAQVPSELPDNKPFEAGRVLLYPLFRSDFLSTNNLYYTRDEMETSTTYGSVSPGLVAELPFSHSYVRLGYSTRYRDYSTDLLSSNTSHFALADSNLVFSNGTYIRITDEFQQGVLDTHVLNGGELTFEGQKFRANTVRVELGQERGNHRKLRAGFRFNTSSYPGDVIAQFYNVTDRAFTMAGSHRVGSRIWLTWELLYGDVDYTRPPGAQFTNEDRTKRDRGISAGYRVEFAPENYLELKVGYLDEEYTSDNSSSFGGVVGELIFRRNPPRGPNLRMSMRRSTFPSLYLDNDYYVNNTVSVRVATARRFKLSTGGELTYTRSDYPQPDPVRSDDTFGLQSWIGYRQNDWAEWRLYGEYRQRATSGPSLEFDVRSVGVAFLFGY